MAPRPTVLLLTNAEHGQANVFLAAAHELILHRDCAVHLGSFSTLEQRVTELRNHLFTLGADGSRLTFHTIAGPSMTESIATHFGYEDAIHPPGVRAAIRSYQKCPDIIATWTDAEYLQAYQSCVGIARKVGPTITVVDSLFMQGLDMCQNLSLKYMVLSPNTLKDIAAATQPKMAFFWKYPALSSGFPFPLPLYLVLINIYLNIRLILSFLFAPRYQQLIRYRKEHGLTNKLPLVNPVVHSIHHLCQSVPEIDFPLVVPANLTLCGPILLASVPVLQSDPELETWLKRAPTVLVNLGSHVSCDSDYASELAGGLRILLDRRPDVQILWKMKPRGQVDEDFSRVLAHEIRSGQVRIENWLKADPLAILRSGQIVCNVNHGGSNSYHEAVSAGVPQLALPQWFDCYDFGARLEYLGIGIYANRKVAPHIEMAEFGQALVTVVGDGKKGTGSVSDSMRRRASELAKICQKSGGRVLVCDKILELASAA